MPKKTIPMMRTNNAPITRARRTDFKTRTEGEDLIIEGYFVVFDQPYYVDDMMEEIVCPGAFDSCEMDDVRALVDHLPHLVLGRTIAHTLSLSLDDYGLFGSIRINSQDTDAVNLHARTQRGDVDQASFGFDEAEDGVVWEDLPNGRIRRCIRHISKLWEVSVCTFPAYEQTYVSARSHAADDMKAAALRAKKNNLKRRLKHHA